MEIKSVFPSAKSHVGGEGHVECFIEGATNAGGTSFTTTKSYGIKSFARSSKGTWVLTLYDAFASLLDINISFQKATDCGLKWWISAHTVTTTKTITIKFGTDESPALASDPLSTTLRIALKMRIAYDV